MWGRLRYAGGGVGSASLEVQSACRISAFCFESTAWDLRLFSHSKFKGLSEVRCFSSRKRQHMRLKSIARDLCKLFFHTHGGRTEFQVSLQGRNPPSRSSLILIHTATQHSNVKVEGIKRSPAALPRSLGFETRLNNDVNLVRDHRHVGVSVRVHASACTHPQTSPPPAPG